MKKVAVLYEYQPKELWSLIRIRNKIGPNMDPFGKPQEISISEEATPLIRVNCFLPFK